MPELTVKQIASFRPVNQEEDAFFKVVSSEARVVANNMRKKRCIGICCEAQNYLMHNPARRRNSSNR
jgi:hypothetical protein